VPEDPDKRAIVPGRPGESELIRRITSTDADERMPPKEAHKVLSSLEVATLVKWIEQGAKYKQHWAYIPPAAVPPSATRFDARATNAIDRYVYARLEKERLTPSAEADRETQHGSRSSWRGTVSMPSPGAVARAAGARMVAPSDGRS
jgi:hypothetical protein